MSNVCLNRITAQTDLKQKDDKLWDFDSMRRNLLNELQDLKGNARVFCRVRPLLAKETKKFQMSHLAFPTNLDTGKFTVIDRTNLDVQGNHKKKVMHFEYNKIFAPESTQMDVFQEVKQLVDCAVMGQNVCIFAYGQTGSGKTYTMSGEGSGDARGIIPRAVRHTYLHIHTYNIYLSIVYCS